MNAVPSSALKMRKRMILAGILLVGIGVGAWVYRRLHPNIVLATREEIEAVLPKELLESPPLDPSAEARLSWVYSDLLKFEPKEIQLTSGPTSDPAPIGLQNMLTSDRIWHDARFDRLLKLLDAGPIRFTPPLLGAYKRTAGRPIDTIELLSKIRLVAKGLADSSALYRVMGDRKESLFCLRSLLKLSGRVWDLRGGLTPYLVAVSTETLAMRTVTDFATDPTTTPVECASLLQAIPPPPNVDDLLAENLRIQFQKQDLPKLPDPFADIKGDGNAAAEEGAHLTDPLNLGFKTSYNAIDTARLLGRMVLAEIENARRPLSRFDSEPERIQQQARKGLPIPPGLEDVDQRTKRMAFVKFRLATYGADNYFGRALISEEFDDKEIVTRSARWRAMRSAVRVLLASRLYRASHAGALPKVPTQFSSILGRWPTDPYDGEPMRYNPVGEVVYAIGQNLIDDGGKIGGVAFVTPDVGVSLALTR
jgi:hypothetical protein